MSDRIRRHHRSTNIAIAQFSDLYNIKTLSPFSRIAKQTGGVTTHNNIQQSISSALPSRSLKWPPHSLNTGGVYSFLTLFVYPFLIVAVDRASITTIKPSNMGMKVAERRENLDPWCPLHSIATQKRLRQAAPISH
jgi:hypothetical protein